MNNVQKYIDYYDSQLDKAQALSRQKGAGGKVRALMGGLVENLAGKIWVTETGGTVKRGDFTAYNTRGNTLRFSVDRHCYCVKDKLRLLVECKSYLDRCYLERADNDFEMIQGVICNPQVQTAILSLEVALADEALSFYKGKNNIDRIFFLLDGKRMSDAPIWKSQHRKSINPEKLREFVEYVSSLA